MIKEIVTSLRGTVTERLSSPLFGSFIIAWMVLNWRIVYTLLRPFDTADVTIEKIESFIDLWATLGMPLAIALFYVAAFPWIRLLLWKMQSEPVRRQRLAECVWEKPLLEARREVISLQHEIALIRVQKESEIEQHKLTAQAQLEQNRINLQQMHEQIKMEKDHDLRLRELELKEREREIALRSQNGTKST